MIASRRASASAFSRHDGERARRAQPGPGRDVGDHAHLERVAVPVAQERLAQDRVADLRGLVDLLELRVLHPVAALEDRVGEHVDVLVDRAADEEAAVLAVVRGRRRCRRLRGETRSGARREDDAHAAARSSRRPRVLLEPVERPPDRLARSSSVGRQPSARMREQSRWISGLSPSQPRRPPVYSSSGATPRCSRDRRDRVVDDDRLVGPEVVDVHDARLDARGRVGERHRRDAVSDVEVRLLLPPVAEHAETVGIVAQAAEEVEDVAVRVALAEDRDEAEDRSR